MRFAFATALALRIAIAFAGTATAGGITAGDLIVIDNANGTLDDIDPTTGKGSVIAGGFSDPQGLAINALGDCPSVPWNSSCGLWGGWAI